VEIIVLDNGSHGINGWELLPQLRRAIPETHTPLILLSLDTQQNQPEARRNGGSKSVNTGALIAELVRVIGAAGEMVRTLIVDHNENIASKVAEVFSGHGTTVKMAHTREQAMDECLSFQPHLMVFNIDLPDNEGLNLVDWLREKESLARFIFVVYSARGFTSTGGGQIAPNPTAFLNRARVQPEKLEALLLTMLRGTHPIEVEQEVPDVSSVRGS
jgi:DNA-binding response OmpR family regulator